jgi:hypothetical protein
VSEPTGGSDPDADDRGDAPGPRALPLDRIVTTGFLVSGFALVVFVLFGVSLPATIILGWLAILAGSTWYLRHAGAPGRAHFFAVLRAGAIAGLVATLAYDTSRAVLVEVFDLKLNPFGAFGAFGDALVPGSGTTGWVRWVGSGYHLVNGISFGIAYAGLFGRRGVLAGIGFALVLEAAMLALYPGWLHIEAVREFTQVSLLGHLCYGAVLGGLTRRLLPDPVRVTVE